jgi:hypothetical protein
MARGGAASFDSVGIRTNDSGLRVNGGNLMASEAPAVFPDSTSTASALLTEETLALAVAEAKSRWLASGLVGEKQFLLEQLSVSIADFGGLVLGHASGTSMQIDLDAAGWGWDLGPLRAVDAVTDAALAADPPARMDLLTVVMHELGHVLGYEDVGAEDLSAGVMGETLSAGETISVGLPVADFSFARVDALAVDGWWQLTPIMEDAEVPAPAPQWGLTC